MNPARRRMLRLALDCGYPSIRLLLENITAAEHRELSDFLSVEPVMSERMDWHFARLYSILVALLGSAKNNDAPEMTDWLLERLIMPKTELDEEAEQIRLREQLRAVMQGFAAKSGATISPVPRDAPTVEDWERERRRNNEGEAT